MCGIDQACLALLGWGTYAPKKPVKAMAPLLRVAALVAGLLFASTAMACEKHLQGHQPGSDTDVEAQNR